MAACKADSEADGKGKAKANGNADSEAPRFIHGTCSNFSQAW